MASVAALSNVVPGGPDRARSWLVRSYHRNAQSLLPAATSTACARVACACCKWKWIDIHIPIGNTINCCLRASVARKGARATRVLVPTGAGRKQHEHSCTIYNDSPGKSGNGNTSALRLAPFTTATTTTAATPAATTTAIAAIEAIASYVNETFETLLTFETHALLAQWSSLAHYNISFVQLSVLFTNMLILTHYSIRSSLIAIYNSRTIDIHLCSLPFRSIDHHSY